MGFLSNFFSNPLNPIKSGFEALADLPGTPESAMNSAYDGFNGDASWNPWDENASVMDEGFLGDHGAESKKNRAAGRAVGTAVGTYFTGGALAPYLGTTGGAAAAGALSGAGQAAGTGGNIGQGALRGGALAGLSSGIYQGVSGGLGDYTNLPASYTDEFAGSVQGGGTGGYLSPAQNMAISRGAANVGTTAAGGGDVRQSGLNSLASIAGSFASPYMSQMGDSMGSWFGGNSMPDTYDGSGGMSTMGGSGRFSDPAFDMQRSQGGPMSTTPQLAGGGSNNFSLSNMDFTSGNLGGSGTIGQPQTKSAGPGADYSLGNNEGMMFGGGDGYSLSGGGPNLSAYSGAPDSAGWQDQFKKFLTGDGGRAAISALSRMDPKSGAMVQALLGGGGQKMGGLEALVGAGATLYARNRADRSLGQQAKQLQDLFSPNSPYAQQMAQKLARQDAAAGRRSQYGNREVELQARLAELNSRNAPQLAALNGAQDMNRMRMLSEMMGYGQRSGAFDYARQGLGQMFQG